MIYHTKEENRIKRKLTRTKRKKISLQNEVAVLNLKITQTDDRNLILCREIILKDIRQLDKVISQLYSDLRKPEKSFDICTYDMTRPFLDLGTRV